MERKHKDQNLQIPHTSAHLYVHFYTFILSRLMYSVHCLQFTRVAVLDYSRSSLKMPKCQLPIREDELLHQTVKENDKS